MHTTHTESRSRTIARLLDSAKLDLILRQRIADVIAEADNAVKLLAWSRGPIAGPAMSRVDTALARLLDDLTSQSEAAAACSPEFIP